MVDLNTNSVVASANIAVLKKALQTEEQLMSSLLEGMAGANQGSLASGGGSASSAPVAGVNTSTTGGVDMYA